MPDNTLVFAKRSLNLSKIFSGLGLFFASFGIFVLAAVSVFARDSTAAVYTICIPFMVFGVFMFSAPIILLYVYDKNNGVLEYLLSLGWNQGDIFKQYLKAALFLALILFIAEFVAVLVVGAVAWSQAVFFLDLLMILLTGIMGFSIVSLVTIALMAFSSLQKQRVGGNSPLALSIGGVIIVPTFYLSAFLHFAGVFLVDLSIALFVGGLSVVLLILSSRLVRREKMLP